MIKCYFYFWNLFIFIDIFDPILGNLEIKSNIVYSSALDKNKDDNIHK